MFSTVLIFLVILVLLILSHEFGHFLLAKWYGVKVEEFGFGLPPRLFGLKRGETLYSLNLLPVGGFVRIEGEEAEDGMALSPRSFASKSIFARALIIGAGVFFNLLLAWILFSAVGWYGAPTALDDNNPLSNAYVVVAEVAINSPAALSGLSAGDTISRLSYDGESLEVSKVKEVQDFVARHAGQDIAITYLRGGKPFTVQAKPRSVINEKEGRLGIAMMRIGVRSVPWYSALWEGLKNTITMTGATAVGIASFIYGLIFGAMGLDGVAGPVGIVNIVSGAVNFGWAYVVQLIAILSINLAVINIIPFPGLDGGRLFFLGVEALRGKPVDAKTSSWAHTIGLILLLIFMFIITYHDIARL